MKNMNKAATEIKNLILLIIIAIVIVLIIILIIGIKTSGFGILNKINETLKGV